LEGTTAEAFSSELPQNYPDCRGNGNAQEPSLHDKTADLINLSVFKFSYQTHYYVIIPKHVF